VESGKMNGLKNTSLVLGFGGLAFFIWGFVELNSHLSQGANIAEGLIANSGNITADYITTVGTAFSILGVATGWDSLIIAIGLAFISLGIATYAIHASISTDRRVSQGLTQLQKTITQQYETMATKLERLENKNEEDQAK
jgi:hypothetical protein